MAMSKTALDLTDEELEDCIDGSSNIVMIRAIVEKPGVIDENGYVNTESFADWFAYGVEGYIDAEPDTDEWHEANENNWDWGNDIAENINALIEDGDE